MRIYVTVTFCHGGADTSVIYAGPDLETAYNLEAFENREDVNVDTFVEVQIWEDGVLLGTEDIK
jgi:hypothetical protein